MSNKDPAGRVTVRAVCYRSMRKHEKPHDLRVGRKKCVKPVQVRFWGIFVAIVGDVDVE